MHGQAVITGTRVPLGVILDCKATGIAADEITAEYPAVTVAGVHAAVPERQGMPMRRPRARYQAPRREQCEQP